MRFLSLILLCSLSFVAQAQEVGVTNRKPTAEAMEELRQLLDLKMYHDPAYVQNAIQMMQNIDTEDADLMYRGVLNDKDSDIC